VSHSSSVATARIRAIPLAVVIAIIGTLLLSAFAFVRTVDAAPVDAGYKDHSWAGNTSVNNPSQDKPQSKVWYTDGSWWGGLFADGEHHIHRYNASTHAWTDTGVAVDARNSSHGDWLWDEATDSLYVASVNGDTDPDPILVFKLNYDAGTDTWTHDADFGAAGIQVGTGPSETVTIAKDSTGQLWVTYQNAGTAGIDVMVNRSTTDEHTWGTAFAIGDASADDISAIIAFDGDTVGVMWSDQNPAENQTFFYFSTHADSNADDTAWSTKQSSAQGSESFAEDHINLKLTATASGEVLAAVKTNGSSVNHIQVLRRSTGGTWSAHGVVDDEGDVTRPQIVVDSTNAMAYVFYTSPELEAAGSQSIYYKSAPLSTLAFSTAGLGTPFIQDGGNDINDVSTSKHPVTESMGGILGIASSDTNESYYHGWISLGEEPESPFTDVPPSHKFYEDIIYIFDAGITTGCTATTFCPQTTVTRGMMATFLSRALDLPAASDDHFTDDDGTAHEDNINRLFEAGITTGCGPTTFCPKTAVNRGMMATFLTRAFELDPAAEDHFTDDENVVHEPNINSLFEAGITTGCGPTTFCPKNVVNRPQMAAFLHRALTD
jgi:hypothetical protein